MNLVTQARALLEGIVSEEDKQSSHWEETLENTPARFVKGIRELIIRGDDFEFTTFPAHVDEMIAMTNIRFNALCAHHLFPFIGVAHVAYVPKNLVAGLSKLVRTVQYYSKGLWMQESLTDRIAERLQTELSPLGIAVVLKAEHLCYTIRGAQSPGTMTTTSKMTGCFRNPTETARQEFFELIKMQDN